MIDPYNNNHRRSLQAALAAALFLLVQGFAIPAWPGSFQVNPVRVELRPGVTTTSVVVRNDGPETVVVQASVLLWTQEDGKDVYTPTQEVIVVPPLATIAPGASQVVRIGLRRTPDATREFAYRLYLQEIPPPVQAGFTGLQVALRVGLPVFVAPVAAAASEVEWAAERAGDGQLRVTARNRGAMHLQVTDFSLFAPDDAEPVAREAQLAYLLAGQTRHWTLQLRDGRPLRGDALRLKAWTDAGELDLPVSVVR